MVMKEVGDIFKEVAQAAGDIVFRYDIRTKKFMQYSDRSELAKYGAWMSDFDNTMIDSRMIYPDDVEKFRELAERIKKGEPGTIDGMFRMRFHISSDYRWHRLIARTKFDHDEPLEVLGRVTDVHNYMESSKEQFEGRAVHMVDMLGFSDENTVLGEIISYERRHRADAMLACILFDIPEYDNIVRGLARSTAEEFLINLIRRIRRGFPHGTLVCRVSEHRFAIFTGALETAAELGASVAKSLAGIKELGEQYIGKVGKGGLGVYVGVDLEKNHPGVGSVLYGRALSALDKSFKKGIGKIAFYLHEQNTQACEAASSEQDDMLAEYVIDMLRADSEAERKLSYEKNAAGQASSQEDIQRAREKARLRVQSGIHILMERIAARYGFERIAMSMCRKGVYEENAHWNSRVVASIPAGCLLHIEGEQDMIEDKVNFWEPYMVNDVRSYPDSSAYGRLIGLSSVRSFAQSGFECANGVRGIVSFEYYTQPHSWSHEEINAFNTVKYVVDFCAKYIEQY